MKKTLTVILFTIFSVFHALAQETVTYQPAQYPGGMGELSRIIAENVRPDGQLLSYMQKEGIHELSATFGLIINTKGKLVAIDMLHTSVPKSEKLFVNLMKRLKKETFIPGTINGEPAVTSVIIREFKHGIMSTTTYTKRLEGRSTHKVIR